MGLKEVLYCAVASLSLTSCGLTNEDMNKQIDTFLLRHDSVVPALQKEMNLAYWNASLSGSDQDFKKVEKLQVKLVEIYSNKHDFELIKKGAKSNAINDPIKKRRIDVLYNLYLSNQCDTALQRKIIAKQNEIEQKYANYRAEIDGKKLTDNEIEEVLKTSDDSKKLEEAWTAHKAIGPVVANDIIELVKLRNKSARELGFKNYHQMSLALSEQDPEMIEKLLNELDELTAPAFARLKAQIDSALSAHYNIQAADMKPWHYQNRYFQEAPKIYPVDLDKYYAGKNIVDLTQKYYASINLDISNLIQKSDLYERPGKNQHAYCMDIDNMGDARVLANIKSNAYWMNTLLHEFGHAAYDKYIDHTLPFDLRNPAHTFTTEAMAMMFGRMNTNPQWIQDVVGISNEEKASVSENCIKTLKLEQLVFSRFVQVMYRFEKGMYENPDQDLNALWWQLVEKYQLMHKPEGRNMPDWATKIHIATSPCYYHNYLMGELLASQVHHYIVKNILGSNNLNNQSYFGNKNVGKYLTEKIFAPGMKLPWNDMIEAATGEKLTAKYYADQFAR
jgi:peptidyl-dipeptidase A